MVARASSSLSGIDRASARQRLRNRGPMPLRSNRWPLVATQGPTRPTPRRPGAPGAAGSGERVIALFRETGKRSLVLRRVDVVKAVGVVEPVGEEELSVD